MLDKRCLQWPSLRRTGESRGSRSRTPPSSSTQETPTVSPHPHPPLLPCPSGLSGFVTLALRHPTIVPMHSLPEDRSTSLRRSCEDCWRLICLFSKGELSASYVSGPNVGVGEVAKEARFPACFKPSGEHRRTRDCSVRRCHLSQAVEGWRKLAVGKTGEGVF